MTQTNSHVDAEVLSVFSATISIYLRMFQSLQRFQECIQKIIGYENVKVFTSRDINFQEGCLARDRSMGGMPSEGVIRKGIIKYPNHDGHGSWDLEVAVKTPRSPLNKADMESLSKV